MANGNDSSQKKPTKKAASRNPSTTSSTTAKSKGSATKPLNSRGSKISSDSNQEDLKPTQHHQKKPNRKSESRTSSKPKNSENEKLSVEQQNELLKWLARGASLAATCHKFGISETVFFQSIQDDTAFAAKVEQVNQWLGQNVASALYRAAMEGSVSAQTFWLRNFPPPGWDETANAEKSEPHGLESLSDEKLIELARAHGIDVPTEIEKRNRSST